MLSDLPHTVSDRSVRGPLVPDRALPGNGWIHLNFACVSEWVIGIRCSHDPSETSVSGGREWLWLCVMGRSPPLRPLNLMGSIRSDVQIARRTGAIYKKADQQDGSDNEPEQNPLHTCDVTPDRCSLDQCCTPCSRCTIVYHCWLGESRRNSRQITSSSP